MAVLWAVTDSKSFGECIHQHKEYKPYHYLHEKRGVFVVSITRVKLHLACGFVAAHENGEAITAIGTLVIAGFTGTLWWATLRMREASERTILTMERTEERQSRAYIFVEENIAEPVYDTETHTVSWYIRPIWKNSGATPPRNLVTYTNIKYFAAGIPDGFDFGDTGTAKPNIMIIGPNQIFHGEIAIAKASELAAVQAGNGTLCFWGWADYNDVFPGTPRRRTEFCFEVLAGTDATLHSPRPISFRPYKRYNGADEDCLRKPSLPPE